MKGYSPFPKAYCINGASPPVCLVTFSGLSLAESYLSAEMLSMYSTAPANWANVSLKVKKYINFSVIHTILKKKKIDFQKEIHHDELKLCDIILITTPEICSKKRIR